MAVEGIGNLTQNLAEQLREQKQNPQAGANTPDAGNADNVAATEDTFTPSTQSISAQDDAQDAGIFQVGQRALTAATANILFEQTTPNTATRMRLPRRTLPRPPRTQAIRNRTRRPVQTRRHTGTALRARACRASAARRGRPSDERAGQVQALNASLPALGLSKEEIQQIDSLATQIQNFNPAAYTTLVNQFEALVQQPTQQDAAIASNSANQNTPATTKANGGGSQGLP